MRYVKLFLMVAKNFFPVLFGEIWSLLKRLKVYHWIIVGLILVLAGGGIFWFQNKKSRQRAMYGDDVSLAEAAKIGEVTTHKLMVQIEEPKGRPEDISGRYRRGDIVLIKDGDFQFSPAEVSGFLILRMDLTPKQAEVLVRSKMEDRGENDPDGNPVFNNVARRRYAVDLNKIGIADGDQQGREVDTVYKWDIVFEKEK